MCPVCDEFEDSQEHLFECRKILANMKEHSYEYINIFSKDSDTLLGVAQILLQLVDIRRKILYPEESEKQV